MQKNHPGAFSRLLLSLSCQFSTSFSVSFPAFCAAGVTSFIWLLVADQAVAQAPPNGTTVYRCIDIQGVVSFADAPCNKSVSHRLRIEHSMIQSVPISVEEQQRLHALEARLNGERSRRRTKNGVVAQKRMAKSQIADERCKQAQRGLRQIKLRKRFGYPISQSKRIDNEELALKGEIKAYCVRN